MKTVSRLIASFFVLLFALTACDDPTDLPPSISGEVSLYDEFGDLLSSADQVQVAALSSSSVKQYLTLTDASGRFELEIPAEAEVPLLFTRDGFGDMFRFDVEEDSGPLQVDLFETSSATVTSVAASAESCGTFNCLGVDLDVQTFFGPSNGRRVFRLFLSTDPGGSALVYEVTSLLFVPNDHPGLVQTGVDATFELDGLTGLLNSFPTGTTVYLVIHGATENLGNSYLEPGTGLEIFTDLSAVSARASFVIP